MFFNFVLKRGENGKMLEEYVFRGTEKLRCGYTTGSCAAAASKAAALMLLSQNSVSKIELPTPKGITLLLEITDISLGKDEVSCAVIKDSGDDPDITNGIAVYAKVRKTPQGIVITGGTGIGKVTKAGLDQLVGEYAINSTPRKMITAAVSEICEQFDYNGGLEITIYVPNGEEISEKTFNPRIGIIGGISIIGTSGIVEPMSSKALVDTIKAEANVLKNEGRKNLLLTLGNYSESFVQSNMPFSLENSVKCSNFIGDAIDIGIELGFEKILIVGHIGKMIKLGAGIMNTHSSFADGRMEVLLTCAVLTGADGDYLRNIPDCATVDAALDILKENEMMEKTLDILVQKVEYYLNAKVKNSIEIGALIFSYKHGFTLKTSCADKLINSIAEEDNG